jgi:hypothetical protein
MDHQRLGTVLSRQDECSLQRAVGASRNVEKHWLYPVTGNHGRSGVRPGLIANLAEGLLESPSCDVLAVPTRQ